MPVFNGCFDSDPYGQNGLLLCDQQETKFTNCNSQNLFHFRSLRTSFKLTHDFFFPACPPEVYFDTVMILELESAKRDSTRERTSSRCSVTPECLTFHRVPSSLMIIMNCFSIATVFELVRLFY